MMGDDPQGHWDRVYTAKTDGQVSWHQEVPVPSLELVNLAGVDTTSAVVDVGGGASRFVDCLLDQGVGNVTVLDISEHALAASAARLGRRADTVTWVVADVTTWVPARVYDFWHDRAVFHFLTDPADRAAYIETLFRSLRPAGHAIIATFALDGPEKCSGLPVVRYSHDTLASTLGGRFEPVAKRPHLHITPWGSEQSFQFSLFRKV